LIEYMKPGQLSFYDGIATGSLFLHQENLYLLCSLYSYVFPKSDHTE
jgi:hypothetical protein